MRPNRGLFNWGIFLLAAGVVALAFRSGLVSNPVFADIGHLWPLVLVGLGIALIAGQVLGSHGAGSAVALILGVVVGAWIGGAIGGIGCQPPGQGHEVTGGEQGTFANEPATVQLFVTCGGLQVRAGSGDAWSAQRVGGQASLRLSSAADSLSVWTGATGGFPVNVGSRDRDESAVTLPAGRRLNVRVEVSAGTADLDLASARLSDLQLTVNAGSLRTRLTGAELGGSFSATTNAGALKIELPTNQAVRGSVTTNAGSVDVCLPADAAIRIQSTGALGGNNFERFGLRRSGTIWESASYASAANKIDLNVTTNAGSTNLKPAGECG